MQPLQREKLFANHELLTLLWPLIIEQTLSVLVGMADTVMVSSVGEAAISGVSLVDMINQLIITVFAALAGGAVVTSQYLGAKKPEQAARSAGQLVGLSALLGLAVAAFCLLTRRPMLRLLFGSITDDVMDAAVIYFTITAISYPFLALYNAGAAIFRSVGNSEVSMRVSVIMNITNIMGNAFCIFVLRMGVAGVAVPTLVSRVLGAVIILKLTTRHDNVARVTWDGVKHLQPQMAKNILYIGIPSALENSLFQLGRVLVVSMISLFGTVHISANAVANNLDGMGCIVGQAIGLAMITVVGRCVGAQQLDQASYFTKKLLLWDYIAQGATNALILIFLNPLLSVYTLSDETRHLAWLLVMIHAGSAIFLHVNPFASLATASFVPPFADMVSTTLFKFDFAGFVNIGWFTAITLVITFCMIDMFDTIGTLVGTASRAGMVDQDGNMPQMKEALLSDAIGTVAGACTGTSTVTTFIESASGVEAGGRTGLTALTSGILFLACMFLAPIAAVIPGAATSAALIYVGVLMLQGLKNVDFSDMDQMLPVSIMLIGMPISGSIGHAIGLGLISYTFVKVLSGKAKDVSVLTYVISALFLVKFFAVV